MRDRGGRPRRRSARVTGGTQIHARAASGQESFVWHNHQGNGCAEGRRREEFTGLYQGTEMILSILQYGDPILRAKGKPVEEIDDRIRELAVNMIETMHAAHGVGLASQQIGEALQLTVLDISAAEDRPSTLKLDGKDIDPNSAMPLVLINPEIELL